jgi:hypothetical protein
MQTKEVKVNEKIFRVRELLGIESDEINWEDKKEGLKKQVMISTDITEDAYNKLTMKERLAILRAINELNTPDDFQKPQTIE